MIDSKPEISKLYSEWSCAQEITPPPFLLEVMLASSERFEVEGGHADWFKTVYWDGKGIRNKQS